MTTRTALLQNAQLYRQIRDNSWTTLRVGVLFGHNDASGAAPPSGTVLAMGLCAGNTNGVGSAVPGHWVGMASWGSTKGSITFSRSAFASGIRMSFPTTGAQIGKIVAGTWTTGGAVTATSESLYFWSTQAGDGTVGNGQKMLAVTFTRAAPNMSVQVFFSENSSTTVSAGFPVPRGSFLSQMEAASPAVSQHVSGPVRTFAVDEATHGVLNHVNIWWNRTSPGVWIDDIKVVKLA